MEDFLSKTVTDNLEALYENFILERKTIDASLKLEEYDIIVTEDIDDSYLERYLIMITAKSFLIFGDAFRGRDDVKSILFYWDVLSLTFAVMPVDENFTDLIDIKSISCLVRFFPDISGTWNFEEEHFAYLENIMIDLLNKVFENEIIREAGQSFLKKGVKILYTQDGYFSEFPEDSEIMELL
jgi:hypothetical protein